MFALKVLVRIYQRDEIKKTVTIAKSKIKTKIINAFANNMSTDTKLSKAQSSSFKFSGTLLGKFVGPYMKVGITVAKNILGSLAATALPFAINGAFQRKLRGRAAIATRRSGVVRARKGITLVISNEYMDDAFRVTKSLKKLGEEIDGVGETVKHEIEKQEGGFLGMLLATLDPSMLASMLTVKCVMRAGKCTVSVETGYNNMDENV